MSEEIRKGRELLKMPVYAIQEGKHLGVITALYVRRSDSTVAAVGFSGGGRPHHLPYGRLRVIGVDAILIDSEAVLQDELPPGELQELDTGLYRRPVITENGRRLGSILGFRVDTATGRIETYRVRPAKGVTAQLAAAVMDRGLEIPVSLVLSLGADALIVSEDAARVGQPEGAGSPGSA